MPYWCGYRDSNSENFDFKSNMYTNSIISAKLWYPCWDSNSEQFLLLRETTFPICPQGHGGLSWDRTNTLTIMSCQHYHYAISPILAESKRIERLHRLLSGLGLANQHIATLSTLHNLGASWENRTPTRRFVAYCNIHFTKDAWYLVTDSNCRPSPCKRDILPLK